MDLISVIVPVYNVEQYLEQCIDSLINQTYNNLEILLINDGSTDSSQKICERYVEIDSRIKLYNKQNEGLGLTRNYGLDKAKGVFVSFVDSDDYIHLNMYRVLHSKITQNSADICMSGYTKVNNVGKHIFVKEYQDIICEKEERREFILRLLGSSPEKENSIHPSACASLIRKEVVTNNNLKFKSEREYISEDLLFQIDVLFNCSKVILISEAMYYYRVNPKSLSSTADINKFYRLETLHNYISDKSQEYELGQEAILRFDRLYFVYIRSILTIISNSQDAYKEKYYMVKEICEDGFLLERIKNYPVYKLKRSARIFLKLITRKQIILILILIKVVK